MITCENYKIPKQQKRMFLCFQTEFDVSSVGPTFSELAEIRSIRETFRPNSATSFQSTRPSCALKQVNTVTKFVIKCLVSFQCFHFLVRFLSESLYQPLVCLHVGVIIVKL
jgi:hypothetical protein